MAFKKKKINYFDYRAPKNKNLIGAIIKFKRPEGRLKKKKKKNQFFNYN